MEFKKAIITGASAGIGQSCAVQLAQEGLDLILLARRADRLEKLKKNLMQEHGVDVRIVAVDVRRFDEMEAQLREIDWTGADVLVNNAGLALGVDKLQDAKITDWDGMIDTNIKGLLYLTRLVLPHFLKSGKGHIVNIGSVAGRWVYPGGAVLLRDEVRPLRDFRRAAHGSHGHADSGDQYRTRHGRN